MLTIVIGDIHGMAAKLENLLGQTDMWCAANARAELRQLIFLGDYIDRGPDSRQVLQIVQRLHAEGAICLQGNHEELMLRATESERDLNSSPMCPRTRRGHKKLQSLGAQTFLPRGICL
jgi:Calcineurin-like phosphoesterase